MTHLHYSSTFHLVFNTVLWINELFSHQNKQHELEKQIHIESCFFINLTIAILTIEVSIQKFCHLLFTDALCHFSPQVLDIIFFFFLDEVFLTIIIYFYIYSILMLLFITKFLLTTANRVKLESRFLSNMILHAQFQSQIFRDIALMMCLHKPQ